MLTKKKDLMLKRNSFLLLQDYGFVMKKLRKSLINFKTVTKNKDGRIK